MKEKASPKNKYVRWFQIKYCEELKLNNGAFGEAAVCKVVREGVCELVFELRAD